MRTLQLLEDSDQIGPDDWVRPLDMSYNQFGDQTSPHSFNMYGGTPQNNVKWINVRDCFGECHWGKTVAEIHSMFESMTHWQNQMQRYEFMRGDVPRAHVWDWRKDKQERDRVFG